MALSLLSKRFRAWVHQHPGQPNRSIMIKKVLSVSWLNGHLQAVVCQGSVVKDAWSCPVAVEHVGELAPKIREAMTQLRYQGEDIFCVLDHRHLVFHLQETPPGSLASLRPLLERKIMQNRFFDEEAVWAAHPPLMGKSHQRFLLTLLPTSVLSGLTGVCEELGLIPTAVFSPASVLSRQFKHLHLQANEATLLVADLGGALCLVAGYGDGQVLFCRNISGSSSQQRLRAGQEINRTLLYVQQQFGTPINSIWVFGSTVFEWLSKTHIRDGLTIRQSPIEESAHYFASAATLIPALDSTNFIPASATRQRLFRRRFACAAVALFLLSFAVNHAVEKVARERDYEVARWTHNWNQLEKYRDTLLFRQREVLHLENSLALIGSPQEPPMIDLFIRSLASAIPASVKLTGVSLAKAAPGYNLRLEGYTPDGAGLLIPVLDQLESSLTNGLFQVRITDSTRARMFGGSESVPVPRAATSILDQGKRLFFVEGHIQ